MKHWQKKELLHVKHYPQTLVFLDLREDRQSDPAAQTRDNAECAPESPAEPAGLVLRMFRLHDRRSSAVGSMFRLVTSESVKAREDCSMFRLKNRASPQSQRSAPTQKPKIPHPSSPDADNSSFTPHSGLTPLRKPFENRREISPTLLQSMPVCAIIRYNYGYYGFFSASGYGRAGFGETAGH